MLLWTGDDGPVTLGTGSVGAEYRGQLGHPSSYGLLGARRWHVRADPGVRFEARPSEWGEVVPTVPGEVVRLGLAGPVFLDAIRDVAHREYVGLTITAAAFGEVGTSPTVFARLATILARVGDDLQRTADQQLWQAWDEGWPS